MSRSLDLINEFEETFEVDKWTVNGLHIWPAIRIPLMTAWERQLYYTDDEFNNKQSIWKKIKSESKLLWLAITTYRSFSDEKKYDIGIWGYDFSRVLAGKKYYSPYGDALQDLEFNKFKSVLCVDCTIQKKRINHYYNIDISLYYFLNRYFSKIKSIIFTGYFNIPLEESIEWCRMKNIPTTGLTKKNIFYQYLLINSLKNEFINIIDKFEMRQCMKVCWYDLQGMALSWAAKESGIPCYDLQHGIAGGTNSRVYSRWRNVPKDGYEIMPDSFWCWTNDDAIAINEWGSKLNNPIQTFVGGNIWQRLWVEKKQPIDIFTANLSIKEYSSVRILYTLQSPLISNLLKDLIIQSPKNWRWFVRCHPMWLDDMHTIIDEIENLGSNVDVVATTKILLPELLQMIDVHITGWSAVVYDAKYFGIRSIVCHPSAYELFENLIKNKDIVYIDNVDEIIDQIKYNLSSYKVKPENKIYPSFQKKSEFIMKNKERKNA
jgi:hypothetical protein